MILGPGRWLGRGSYRAIDTTQGTPFSVDMTLTEEEDGRLLEALLEVEGQSAIDLTVWIVPDEYGGYTVTVRGPFHVDGTAKLESAPHLGLLWSEDGATHAAFALFELRDTYGLRGFARNGGNAATWELALRPRSEAVAGGNVVAFRGGRRGS